MRVFHSLWVLPVAAMAMCPLHADASSDVTMHIVATGTAPPDTVILPVSIDAYGKTDAQARESAGVVVGRIKSALISAGGKAEDVSVSSSDNRDTTIHPVPSVPAIDGSGEPARDAATAASSTILLQITMNGIDRLGKMQEFIASEKFASSGDPVFFTRDADKARSNAIADAVRQARSDAAQHADALGYRIVRITRISNQRPPLNIPDVVQVIRTMGNMRGNFKTLVPTDVSVEIDYIIAPK